MSLPTPAVFALAVCGGAAVIQFSSDPVPTPDVSVAGASAVAASVLPDFSQWFAADRRTTRTIRRPLPRIRPPTRRDDGLTGRGAFRVTNTGQIIDTATGRRY